MSHESEKPPAEMEPPPAPVAQEDPSEAIEEKCARFERERDDARDRMLRVAAEFENWKKRARREAEDAATRGREQLAKELLPALDNFERALEALANGGTLEQLGQGVKLVDKQLHSVLEKFEIKGFEAQGEPFDPNRHDAIQQLETSEVPPGTVAKVFSRGYLIGPRLLRAAMVAVAKQPSAPPPESVAGAPHVDIKA